MLAHAWLLISPLSHGIGSFPDTQCACEQYRGFELSEFMNLCRANQLSIAVADVNASGYRMGIKVTWRRNYCCNTGTNIVTLNDRRVTDLNPGNVRDRIVSTGWKYANDKPDIPGSWSIFVGGSDSNCSEY